MPADTPKVAVIIVTYDSRQEIGACLDALAPDFEGAATVTVVDNQSTDGTAGFVRQRWPLVRVIEAGGNLGFSRANNIGIAATRSEYVLLLNPDTIATPEAIARLVSALDSQPDAGIAGPRLLDEHRQPELSFGPPISPWGELTQKLRMALYARRVPMAIRARELGMSLSELRAATLAATGLTPVQLLIDSRLARAQSLLVETDLEVGAIARQVGFEDPSYFTRQFVQRLGRTPSMFRDEQRRMPMSAGLQPEQVLR